MSKFALLIFLFIVSCVFIFYATVRLNQVHTVVKRMLDEPIDTLPDILPATHTPNHVNVSNTEDAHVDSIPTKYTTSNSINSSATPDTDRIITESNDHSNDPFFKIKQKKKAGLPIIIGTINMCSWMIKSIELSEKCLEKKCVITQDNITENSDVVIVMGNALKDHMQPTQRWPGQLYVLVDREPPPVALSHSTIANGKILTLHCREHTFSLFILGLTSFETIVSKYLK